VEEKMGCGFRDPPMTQTNILKKSKYMDPDPFPGEPMI